jgi:hypothetical protein
MSTRVAVVVLHCKPDQYKLINERGHKVKENLYVNTTLYTIPKVAELDYNEQLTRSDKAKAAAMKGGVDETAIYYKETTKVYDNLVELCIYVNGLYRSNKVNLMASGFDVVSEAVPQELPSVPDVNRVVAGAAPHSAKFYNARIGGLQPQKKSTVVITVQMSEDPSSEANFDTVLETTNRNKLLVTGLTRAKEVYFRLNAMNRRGVSDWTDVIPFVPY